MAGSHGLNDESVREARRCQTESVVVESDDDQGYGCRRAHWLGRHIGTAFAQSQWRDNGALFPRGVDVLFICGSDIAALPRTTRVEVTCM